MKSLLSGLIVLFVGCLGMAQETTNSAAVAVSGANGPAVIISAAEAKQHIGKYVTVTGKVAEVHVSASVVRLNIDKSFPTQPFTGVIFAKQTNKFTNLPDLKGKHVAISGKVAEYRLKPEIILDSTNQLRVLPDAKK